MFHLEERGIVKRWDELMQNYIKNDMTFLVHTIKKEEWGYNLMVTIPPGRTFEELEKTKDAIRVFFPCNVEMEIRNLTELANVKIITKDFTEKEYKPIELKGNEIFLGYDLMGNPIIVDMNRFPHCLIAGSTGSGKSRLVFMILTNLIYNNNCILYLTQIRKRDFKKFKCFAKEYAETEEEASYMFNNIVKEINRRVDYLDSHSYENIEECKNMKPIYVFGDEFSFYMEDKTDDANMSKYKSICLSRIKEIIKTGRSVGVFLIICIQRTTATELLPIVKSQMRTIITFNQVNKASSQNVLGNDDALMLKEREFIIMTNKLQHCKTPYIDKNMIESYISLPNQTKPHSEGVGAIFVPSSDIIKPKPIETPKKPKGVMKNANAAR